MSRGWGGVGEMRYDEKTGDKDRQKEESTGTLTDAGHTVQDALFGLPNWKGRSLAAVAEFLAFEVFVFAALAAEGDNRY